jgi:hypothetical protein
MAQIDPSIPLQAKMPQIENPVNVLGRAQEVSINALKMGEMQRGIESQNKLRQLYSQGVDVSTPEGFKQLAAIDPATAMKLRADELKTQETRGNIKKTNVEITAKEMDIAREGYKNLEFNPSDNNFKSFLEDAVLSGKMTPAQAQQQFAEIAPLNVEQRKQFIKNRALKAEQLFNDITQRRGQDISATTTRRGQDLTNERALETQRLQYGPDVVANTVTDAAGNVTQFNRQGQIIGKPGQVGKPSATFEKTAALQKQTGKDLDLAIKELTEATKDKGLIDQSTGSGAGRLVDVAAGFAGQATPGAIAIAKLKPIADIALKMVPRFEGPQSDKDTQTYKEAAGQLADPSLPTQIRKEAGREVLRLMKARKGQFVNEAMANEGIGAGGVDTSNPLLK